MEKQFKHRIFALLFVIVVLFPSTIQVVHALENHEHVVCTAKDIKHIHKQDIDCSVFHFQVQQHTFNFSTDYDFVDFQIVAQNSNHYTPSTYRTYLISKSSRGPPYFIV